MLKLSDDAGKRLIGKSLHKRETVWVRFTYNHYVVSGYTDKANWEFEISSDIAHWTLATAWKMYDKGLGVGEAISMMNAHVAVKRNVMEAIKRTVYPRYGIGGRNEY